MGQWYAKNYLETDDGFLLKWLQFLGIQKIAMEKHTCE